MGPGGFYIRAAAIKPVYQHQFSSVAQSCPTHETLCDLTQHARPLCPSPTPGARSDSRPSSQ